MRVRSWMVGAALLGLTGCESYTQTTSGSTYLDKYELDSGATGRSMDEAVRASAAVEPLLTFPARLGIARISHGQLTAIPPVEAEAWLKLAERLGPDWGQIVPVSPLIAKLATDSLPRNRQYRYGDTVTQAIEQIRLGAARQHIEAVLIYEVAGRSDRRSTPLSISDLTVVGLYVMPSRLVEARGAASALLVDVRNGYPYGFTDPVITDDWTMTTKVGADERQRDLQTESESQATLKLVGAVETMLTKLRPELEARRTQASAKPAEPIAATAPVK